MEQYYHLMLKGLEKMINDCEKGRVDLQQLKDWKKRWEPQMEMLEEYYRSEYWQADVEAKDKGLLHSDISFNVLSKEAMDDLIDGFDAVGEKLYHKHFIATLYGPLYFEDGDLEK